MEQKELPPLAAERLRGAAYVVRPAGALGPCGWINGKAWTAVTLLAWSADGAVRRARGMVWSMPKEAVPC